MPDQSIDAAQIRSYENFARLLAQQAISRLQDKCQLVSGLVRGKNHKFDRLGAMALTERTSRYGDTQYNDAPWTARVVAPRTFNGAELVDSIERVKMGFDPNGPLARSIRMAAKRVTDDIIIEGALGTASTGEDGTGTETFPAGQVIAVDEHDLDHETAAVYTSSNVPMTVGKFLAGRAKLGINEADDYDMGGSPSLYCTMSSQQLAAMHRAIPFTSSDYKSALGQVVNFQTNTFLGVEIVRTQRNLTDGNSYERCIMWHRDGLGLAFWEDITAKIEQIATKNYAWQVWLEMIANAVRIESERVVEIKCVVPAF